MGTEIRNADVEQARAELAQQLAPRDEQGKGDVLSERYAEATAEQKRLQNEYRSGHGK